MRRLLVVVVALLACTAGGAAAAYQDPPLNDVASAVAGHPVIASCAATSVEWSQFEATGGYPAEVDGFTFVGRDNVIFLAPRICQTLTALLGPAHDDVGPYWAALAIKVLIHESIHQRGVLDEGVTDCTALPLVPTYAASSFGYPATISQVTFSKVKGGLYKRTVKTIPNPVLAKLAYWALQWHRAQPANYQGGC